MKSKNVLYTVCAFLVTLLAASEAVAQSNVIDEVVWVVGDEPILKSDVEQARLDAITYRMRIDGDPYCVIPEQLAIQKLFLHQAAIDSIDVKVTDADSKTGRYIISGATTNTETDTETGNKEDVPVKEVATYGGIAAVILAALLLIWKFVFKGAKKTAKKTVKKTVKKTAKKSTKKK